MQNTLELRSRRHAISIAIVRTDLVRTDLATAPTVEHADSMWKRGRDGMRSRSYCETDTGRGSRTP
jgi:hypothetical protein